MKPGRERPAPFGTGPVSSFVEKRKFFPVTTAVQNMKANKPKKSTSSGFSKKDLAKPSSGYTGTWNVSAKKKGK